MPGRLLFKSIKHNEENFPVKGNGSPDENLFMGLELISSAARLKPPWKTKEISQKTLLVINGTSFLQIERLNSEIKKAPRGDF